jgi:seryl-tRNA synthetase
MLTIKLLREQKDEVVKRLKIKNFDAEAIINDILEIDNQRKETQAKLDNCLAESNNLAKQIGQLFKEGKQQEANEAKERTGALKTESKELGTQLSELENKQNELIVQLPNIPSELVPPGKGADDNVEVKSGGSIPALSNEKLAHWDLAKKYDLIDFELGNKITGSGFPVYKGKGAKLQRALITYFLDRAVDAGYFEVIPPLVVNEASGFGTGQLPDKEGQMYHVTLDNFT